MSYTPLETKLRLEILANAGLSGFFGSNIFDASLPQGLMGTLPMVRALTIQRVSTTRMSSHQGINSMALIRIQFKAYCKGVQSNADALTALKLIVDFLNTFCATSMALFTSPPTTPAQFPNTVMNEMVTPYPNTLPPLYMGVLDARIYNREDL